MSFALSVLSGSAEGETYKLIAAPRGERDAIDLSAAGSFLSPFWATFGYFHPGELSGAPGSALLAPLFMAGYLLAVLTLFVNLLIAMFNDRYKTTMAASRELLKMINVRRVAVYLMQYPVPPPLNLLVLPVDALVLGGRLASRWAARHQHARKERRSKAAELKGRMQRSKAAAAFGGGSGGGKPGSAAAPPVPPSPSTAASHSRSLNWRDRLSADAPMGTRRHLMERGLQGQRPFRHDDSMSYNQVEASAVERDALDGYLRVRDTLERRRHVEMSEAKEEIHRRLDALTKQISEQMGAARDRGGAGRPTAAAPAMPAATPVPPASEGYLPILRGPPGFKWPVRDPSCLPDLDESRRAAQPTARQRRRLAGTPAAPPPTPTFSAAAASAAGDALTRQHLAALSSKVDSVEQRLREEVFAMGERLRADARQQTESTQPPPLEATPTANDPRVSELLRNQEAILAHLAALTGAQHGCSDDGAQSGRSDDTHMHMHVHMRPPAEPATAAWASSHQQPLQQPAHRGELVSQPQPVLQPYGQVRAALPPVHVYQPTTHEGQIQGRIQGQRVQRGQGLRLVPTPGNAAPR